MPTDQRIDYIELPASDFDAFEKFYSSTFGWKFTDYGPDYRAFNDGQLDGGIFKSELSSTTDHGAALVILYATDLEATRGKIVANGGTICRETFEFPGGRRFQFLDPHGNELGVWSDNK
ncbi:MAG: VOC family protein [Bythopirellula sp.]